MCREGGCGACLVHAERFDSATQKWQDFSVNSVSQFNNEK